MGKAHYKNSLLLCFVYECIEQYKNEQKCFTTDILRKICWIEKKMGTQNENKHKWQACPVDDVIACLSQWGWLIMKFTISHYLQKLWLRLWVLPSNAEGRSCCLLTLWQYYYPHGPSVPLAIVLRSRMLDALLYRIQGVLQLRHGNIWRI